MLSHLPSYEPTWLNGPEEPNPRLYSGTCPNCKTEHFNGPGKGIGETRLCSCGTAMCCDSCSTCEQCGDAVCPQCSVTARFGNSHQLICSSCYEQFLEDTYTSVADPAPVEPVAPLNAHVHPTIAHLLNQYAPFLSMEVRK